MIGSKLVPFTKLGLRYCQRRPISLSAARRSGAPWTYRSFAPADPVFERMADVAGTFMWWWIFWHCFTDYGHIIGEWDYPDIMAWTDEELGIPPDEADDPE